MKRKSINTQKQQQDLISTAKSKYPMKEHRNEESFLKAIKKSVERDKDFYEACGIE